MSNLSVMNASASAGNPSEGLPVSELAVCQRINRKLRWSGRLVRKSFTAQMEASIGEYYILKFPENYIDEQGVDLARLAEELGVLQPGEYLDDGVSPEA